MRKGWGEGTLGEEGKGELQKAWDELERLVWGQRR